MKPKKTYSILLGTFILMIISFYNGYPLVYSDSGTYIYCGFNFFIPWDRPIPYGLFVLLSSAITSLWLVVLLQNIITTWILYEICVLFIPWKSFYFYFSFIILFLTLFTGCAWYSNQIMPDFLAPLGIMVLFILIFSQDIGKWAWFFYSGLYIFISISHFSHLLIGLALIIIIGLLGLVLKYYSFQWKEYFVIPFKRWIIVFSITISGWIILPVLNYVVEGKFILSKGSHVFLMAHFVDTGILERFLINKCGEPEFENCRLCNYKDSLPRDLATFIWEDNGTLSKLGGWQGTKEEFNWVIKEMNTNTKYLAWNIYNSITNGFSQLFMNEIGQGLTAYSKGSPPYQQIHWRFRDELNSYLKSKQNMWNGVNLSFKVINVVNVIILSISLFILLYIVFTDYYKSINPKLLSLLLFVILGIIVNSMVTAGLNSPCERFQARVVWLLPFCLLIIIINHFIRVSDNNDIN